MGWFPASFLPPALHHLLPMEGVRPLSMSPSLTQLHPRAQPQCPQLLRAARLQVTGKKGSGARGGETPRGRNSRSRELCSRRPARPRGQRFLPSYGAARNKLTGRARTSSLEPPRFPRVYNGMKAVHMFTERETMGETKDIVFPKDFLAVKGLHHPAASLMKAQR